MAGYVGAVIFGDSSRLYLIYDGTLDAAKRPLFRTEKEACDWHEAGAPPLNKPNEADESDEPVTVMTDLALDENGETGLHGSFASRASKKAMWLTGSRSFMEMIYANGATACRDF